MREDGAQSERASTRPVADAAFELAHAGTLRMFPELVMKLGGDPDEFLGHVGLEASAFAQAAPRLNYRAMIGLLEHAAARLHIPDFGMRLAAMQGGGRVFGPIGVVMRNSGTLGDALHYVADHVHAYSLAANMLIDRDRAKDRMVVGFDILLDNIPGRNQTIEQLFLLGHYNAREITGGRARARQVRFRHQPMLPIRAYREYFGCEVLFDQGMDAILFSREDIDQPIVEPDAAQYRMAASFIDANYPAASAPIYARVRGLVMKYLGVSDCKADRIADELCLHPRTLRRRLRWERKSFESIKDEVRRDRALYYIERTDVPFTRISEKLGYSETSVLSRSCLRWFGACPRELRSRVRAGRRNRPDALVPLAQDRGVPARAGAGEGSPSIVPR